VHIPRRRGQRCRPATRPTPGPAAPRDPAPRDPGWLPPGSPGRTRLACPHNGGDVYRRWAARRPRRPTGPARADLAGSGIRTAPTGCRAAGPGSCPLRHRPGSPTTPPSPLLGSAATVRPGSPPHGRWGTPREGAQRRSPRRPGRPARYAGSTPAQPSSPSTTAPPRPQGSGKQGRGRPPAEDIADRRIVCAIQVGGVTHAFGPPRAHLDESREVLTIPPRLRG